MAVFIPDNILSLQYVRQNATLLNGTETLVFREGTTGSFWIRIESPQIGQVIAGLPDLSIIKGAGSGPLLYDVTYITGMTLYQYVENPSTVESVLLTLGGLATNSTSSPQEDQVLKSIYPTATFIDNWQKLVVKPGFSGPRYTDEFYLRIDGSPIPGFLDLPLPNAGRMLVTAGTITGARDAAWGSWRDEVIFGTEPYANPAALQDLAPAAISWTGGMSSPNGYVASSRGFYYDEATGNWNLAELGRNFLSQPLPAPFEERDRAWLVGTGAEAFMAGQKDALVDEAKKGIDALARAKGLGTPSKYYGSAEKALSVREALSTFFDKQLKLIDQAFKPGFDGKAFDRQNSENIDELKRNLLKSVSPAFVSNTIDSMKMVESHSDIFFTLALGDDPFTLQDHNNAVLASGRADTIAGGNQLDTLMGGGGDDSLSGGGGDDALWGGNGYDLLDGGDGNDVLVGGADDAPDVLSGGSGDDDLYGEEGDDSLSGGGGNDKLDGGLGNDTMAGGAGNDQYIIGDMGEVITEDAGVDGGIDTAWVNVSTAYQLGPNVEIGRLFANGLGLGGAETPEQLVANAGFSSQIAGNGGDDVLWGSALANTLDGGAGDDIIRSQTGGGLFIGGTGHDQFVVSNLATSLVENVGEGTDTAWVTVNGYTVGPNIEIIRLAGTATQVSGSATPTQMVANPTAGSDLSGGGGDDVVWGSPFSDTLRGHAGADIFRGQGGTDTMIGGLGDDQFVVLDPGVVIQENAGEGYDTAWLGLAAGVPFALAANVERGNLSAAANMLTGNGLDNVLVGDAVASQLDGGPGHDIIFASPFADTLTGGAGDDILYSYGGADRFIYGGPGWGFDQIAGFDRAAGAQLDFRGSGITFAQLTLTTGGGNSQAAFGDSAVLVYGVDALKASDFLLD